VRNEGRRRREWKEEEEGMNGRGGNEWKEEKGGNGMKGVEIGGIRLANEGNIEIGSELGRRHSMQNF
jgi:hypothetical protein